MLKLVMRNFTLFLILGLRNQYFTPATFQEPCVVGSHHAAWHSSRAPSVFGSTLETLLRESLCFALYQASPACTAQDRLFSPEEIPQGTPKSRSVHLSPRCIRAPPPPRPRAVSPTLFASPPSGNLGASFCTRQLERSSRPSGLSLMQTQVKG